MEGRGRQNLSSPALFFASSLETNTEVTKKAISSILKYFASLGKKIFRTFAWSKALNKTQCFMRLDLMVKAVQNVSQECLLKRTLGWEQGRKDWGKPKV